MARDNSPGSARTRSAGGRAARADIRAAARSTEAPSPPQNPIDSAIDTLFTTDDRVRDALTTRLKERSEASDAVAKRAVDAFENFTASRRSEEERAQPQYFAAGDDLTHAHKAVITEGVAAMRKSDVNRSMTIRPGESEKLKALIDENGADGDSLAGTMDLQALVSYVNSTSSAGISLNATPEFTSCQAEVEAERRLKAVEAPPKTHRTSRNGGSSDSDEGTGTGKPAEFVRANVKKQMGTATSPESELSYAVPGRTDRERLQEDEQEKLQKSIETFELRNGPSDVTSYHDFNTLQIAFQSVWTEVFDGQLTALGQELFQECVKLKEFAGLEGKHRDIDTIDDLRDLMNEVRSLSRFTQEEIPWQPRATTPADGVSVNSTSAVDFTKTLLDPASVVTDAIGDKTVAAIVDPLGAAIDFVSDLLADKRPITWASFPGPFNELPAPHDYIFADFQENAVAAGEVEIVLKDATGASKPWKGLGLYEFDETGKLLNTWKISNWKDDNDVWDKQSYYRLPLYTPQIKYGLIEFDTEITLGIHHGFFLLGNLDQKIKDRTRVTFTWGRVP
jgi:hypothetical protein